MPDTETPADVHPAIRAAYDIGWRDYDRGGSRAMRRRIMVRRVDHLPGNEPLLDAWAAGWADNQNGRGYSTTLTSTATQEA